MSRFIYYYAECYYDECHYAECCYAECNYAECCYAECRYAECRSALEEEQLIQCLTVPNEIKSLILAQ